MADQTAADPAAAVPTGRRGEYRDPTTGAVYLAPSEVSSASLDPSEQAAWETNVRLANLERNVETQLAAKGVEFAAPTLNNAARGVEDALTQRDLQHPAVAQMARALEGWGS